MAVAIQFETFFLIFARIIAFFVAAPVFSMRGISVIIKISLALLLTLIVIYAAPLGVIDTGSSIIKFAVLVIAEALLGLSIGFLANLVFMAIQMGGQMIDFQMGLSIGSVYDPSTQTQSTLYGSLYNWMAMLLLFAVNGHHFIIYSLVKSFEVLPIGVVEILKFSVSDVVIMFTRTLGVAFQICIPVVIILLLTDIIMGVISRTVPQLQIFILAIPVKIMLGTLFLIAMAPITFSMVIPIIEQIPQAIENALRAFMIR